MDASAITKTARFEGSGIRTRGVYLAVLMLAVLASSCQRRVGSIDANLPVIVVDDGHNHLGPTKAAAPAAYTIAPADGFVLDVTGYTFSAPSNSPATIPNVAQVLVDKNKSMYVLQWSQSAGKHRVSAATLSPLRRSPPFQRLEAGTTVVIAIGYQRGDAEEPEFGFYPFWASLVKIQPAGK
ncbi:MAG: hypothetical protein ACT4PY_13325 [Armatimonadota bacterium]